MLKRFLAFAAALSAAGALTAAAPPEQEYRFFESSGERLAYLEKGRGEPIILLHGGLADSEFNWIQFGILEPLAENHRVIALDLRGHGRSAKPHGVEAYGRKMAGDVLALLNHLAIPKAHLLGYSLGSLIAMTLVADHPDRVISAAFGGPGWLRPDSDLSIYRKTADSLDAGNGLGPLLQGYSDGIGKPLPKEELDKLNAYFAARNDLIAIAGVFRSFNDLIVTEAALRRADIPCLFLYGTKDDNRDDIPLLRKTMGEKAAFVDIPDAAHGDAIVRPEFREAVLRFFAPRAKEK